MVLPLLPLFLVGPLAAPVWAVGLVEGVGEATAALLRGVSGWWSDRVRRRVPFVVGGYSLSAASKPAFALVTSWPGAALARFGDRAGKGLRTAPRDALLAESVPRGFLGRGFGLHRAMDTAGAFVGGLVALGLLVLLLPRGDASAFRLIFLLSAIPALAAVVVLALFVREPARHDAFAARPLRVRDALREPRLARFLLATLLLAFANVSFAFLLLASVEAGASTLLALGMYVAANGVYAALAFPAGALADRIGRRRALLLSFAILATLLCGLALSRTVVLVAVFVLLWGVFQAVFEGQAKAYASEIAPPHLKGTVLGLQTTVLGVAALPAGLLVGGLWTLLGPAVAFGVASGFAVAAGVVLALGSTD